MPLLIRAPAPSPRSSGRPPPVPFAPYRPSKIAPRYDPLSVRAVAAPAGLHREVPNEHEAFGFPFEAKPHRLDLVVRCDAGYLSCSLGRVQASRQDFGCLAGAQLFAVLNPVEGELELRQENLPFSRPPFVGQWMSAGLLPRF